MRAKFYELRRHSNLAPQSEAGEVLRFPATNSPNAEFLRVRFFSEKGRVQNFISAAYYGDPEYLKNIRI